MAYRLAWQAPGLVAAMVLIAVIALPSTMAADNTLRVGSKRFTESYILGELLVQSAMRGGPAEHQPGLGNTGILYAALRAGSIDVYPEYTGTISREILKLEGNPGYQELNAALAPLGLAVSVPLGFNNSYALGVREDMAAKLRLNSISDLAAYIRSAQTTTSANTGSQGELRLGFSQEFLARKDGWPGLARAYGLSGVAPVGLDHGLAYEALAANRIDVMDLYSTDAKIARYGIRVLEDDRQYFPRYDAVLLHRAEAPSRFARQWQAIAALEGALSGPQMIKLNAAAELEGRSFADAAAQFLNGDRKATAATGSRGFIDALLAPDLWRLTREHLFLVFGSLAAAIVAGVPLGVLAARRPRLSQAIFAMVGMVQTIPSLALLAFMIAIMGSIGALPAMIALFLYALLPIVRNTHAGLQGVGEGLRQAAVALGLSRRDQLLRVELPLALPTLLAGVKISAVINVGTATIAAFIGAGGYGDRIAAGLALNDHIMLMAGAVPAAALALAVQVLFELLERRATPGRG